MTDVYFTDSGESYIVIDNIQYIINDGVIERSVLLASRRKVKLPSNITIDGALDVSCSRVCELPENLTIRLWCDLTGCDITSLPENMVVGEWLDISGTAITTLPASVKAKEIIIDNGQLDVKSMFFHTLKNGIYVRDNYWSNLASLG